MIIKTAELEGAALDWAVAKAAFPLSYLSGDRLRVRAIIDEEECTIGAVFLGKPAAFTPAWTPSSDWSQGGPLIEHYRVEFYDQSDKYTAIVEKEDDEKCLECGCVIEGGVNGSTHLIAAMRAIVASELGNEVDVPKDLTHNP